MSAYEVSKFCRQCLLDPELRALAVQDPVAAVGRFDLTDTERALLLDGQVGELHLRGASSFLLSYLPRWTLFGVTAEVYSARMVEAGLRAAGGSAAGA